MEVKKLVGLMAVMVAGAAGAVTPEKWVEYVEATGTQYVDLDVTATGHVRVEASVAWTEKPYDCSLVAAREDETRFYLIHNASGKISYGYGSFYSSGTVSVIGQKTRIESEFQAGSQKLKVNENETYSTSVETAVSLDRTFYLFACNDNGRVNWSTRARLYSLRLWQDGELVRDLRPCVNGGVAGLYDAKRDEILYSAKDPLVASPDPVRDEPVAYLEYLASDGTQFIDTEIVGRNGTKAELDVAMVQANGDVTLIGSFGYNRFYLIHDYNRTLSYGYNAHIIKDWLDPTYPVYTLADGVRVRLTGEIRRGHQELTADGVTVFATNDAENVSEPCSLYLYGCNYGGSEARYLSKMRVYGAKVWQDGELVRDFLPCICKHTPGLIDRVSGRFFTSTNGFPASCCGPVTNGFAVGTRPDFRLEYVASDGSADTYVDTGVRGQNTVGMETEMMWETVPSDGSYLASRLGNDTRVYLYHHYGSHLIGYGGYSDYLTGVKAEAKVKYRISSLLANGDQRIKVESLADDAWTEVTSRNKTVAKDMDTGYSLYLFACNKDGGPTYAAKSRCYSLRLWKDGQLVRDFVPVSYAGIPMLWDEIGEKLYPSSGAKHLVAGPVTGKYMRGAMLIVR